MREQIRQLLKMPDRQVREWLLPACALALLLVTAPMWAAQAADTAAPTPHAKPELRVVVDTSTEMPMMLVRDGHLVDGVHLDLGLALARQLGRQARFELLPRKRVVDALANGGADISCHYLAEWMPGEVDWSKPFFPNAQLLVSAPQAPRPASLEALAGVPVGTVLGFYYPVMDSTLGTRFVRDVAPNSQSNLAKLAAGRVQYAVVGELFYRYQLSLGTVDAAAPEPLVVQRYKAQCAVSRKGQVTVQELNKAIEALERGRQIQAIMDKYAPAPQTAGQPATPPATQNTNQPKSLPVVAVKARVSTLPRQCAVTANGTAPGGAPAPRSVHCDV